MLENTPLILAIDDSQLVLTQLEFLIANQTPCNFIGFDCGFKALSSQKLHKASLILLDMNMPSIDGVEMLRKLSELDVRQPLALLSGENSLFLKNAASLASLHGLNIISCIEKPLSVSKLADLYKKLYQFNETPPSQKKGVTYSNEEVVSALYKNEYLAYLQPKVCSKTEKIIGVETLARWNHPENGIVSPFYFIETLENENHTAELTEQLLKQTVNLWSINRTLLSGLPFSFNISANELSDINLPEKLEHICSDASIPTSQITLELTESNIINNIRSSLDVLLRFKLKGFKLSIDDFGTGYSSMKQLNELPFDELKIDRCFVNGCADDTSKKAIVVSTCEMAHKLGLDIVAEGVEKLEDLLLLKSLGVKAIQGFYYFKPCSQTEFLQLFQHQKVVSCSSSL
ncbi:EAL domain-containing protein [Pseudoalteromonas sp. PA2MD11]|uniref:EAL domain-containing response regulator n=1 Tax=Pseudoalteromonas sp. PA2MD11 TaxID=2785057 RepID=UPI001AE0A479|nr:EAL domain-containing response regulator [Pseudoalteromonas sp. PA2MD11]